MRVEDPRHPYRAAEACPAFDDLQKGFCRFWLLSYASTFLARASRALNRKSRLTLYPSRQFRFYNRRWAFRGDLGLSAKNETLPTKRLAAPAAGIALLLVARSYDERTSTRTI